MKASELKKKYLDFFVKKDHKILPNVSLVPEDDPTVLFTTAGMHPLVPYLLGEVHPLGKRLCSVQRCLRTDDIDNVGDGFHHTFFEMLGNWSLGDYWKEEALSWSWQFLTKILDIDPKRIFVSCFAGDKDAPKDTQSALIWKKLGIPAERIYFLSKKYNWWGPVGKTGPCGPDSEMFIDVGKPKCSSSCDVTCSCGKYLEVWNDVFMEYFKTKEGKYKPLRQKNVDTGMGVERMVAITSGFMDDDYRTELFWPIIQELEKISQSKYEGENQKIMRIVTDHLRAGVFLFGDGVIPSNKDRGYVLRRLIRRAVFKLHQLGCQKFLFETTKKICQKMIEIYSSDYPQLQSLNIDIYLGEEIEKFSKILQKGIKFLEKCPHLDGKIAFNLFQSYGIPLEITQEIAKQRGQIINKKEFEKEFKDHQRVSRHSLAKKFAGGLADYSLEVTKLHTATHLLHQALRDVLGKQVRQVGSNITPHRLRFDFTYPSKLTNKQLAKIEKIINEKIKENLPVKMEIMRLEEAKKKGSIALFSEKYGQKVKVYSIGGYSKEVCGGPHVDTTGQLGYVKIIKEEAVGAGRRRIYAVLK